MGLDSILILAAAGATFVKYLVDAFTIAWPARPPWAPILLAFLLGVGVIALLEIAQSVELTSAVWAQTILAGIVAGATAAGLTASSNTAQTKRADTKDASGS